MADAPEKKLLESCQAVGGNPRKCRWAAKDDDPCKGCKVAPYRNYRPSTAAQYAGLLSVYVETFNLKPEDLAWWEMDCLQALQTAKNEFEKDTMDRMKDKSHG